MNIYIRITILIDACTRFWYCLYSLCHRPFPIAGLPASTCTLAPPLPSLPSPFPPLPSVPLTPTVSQRQSPRQRRQAPTADFAELPSPVSSFLDRRPPLGRGWREQSRRYPYASWVFRLDTMMHARRDEGWNVDCHVQVLTATGNKKSNRMLRFCLEIVWMELPYACR